MKGKIRTIYNNYDLWEDYEKDVREILSENGNFKPSDKEIWEEIYFQDEINWEYEKENLDDFFKDKTWIIFGTVQRWNGMYPGGIIFTDFWKAWDKATVDCEYFHLYDVNGHFYIKCSHHDGTNLFEIKQLTEKGERYYENWEYKWNDSRSEKYVHKQIIEKYSTLPYYAHKVFGVPKKEYEKKAG